MRALCVGLVLCLTGCASGPGPDQWERVLVRAPTLQAFTSDGVLAGEVTLSIDPPAVLARVRDVITWTVTFANGLVGTDVIVRAGVSYTLPDGTRQSLTTQAVLSIDATLLDIILRLYVPDQTGYVPGSLGAELLPPGGGPPVDLLPPEIWGMDGELYLHLAHDSLAPGGVLTATYATEVGGTTVQSSVVGTVLDSTTGAGVGGALVTIGLSGAVTDSGGAYTAVNVPSGSQELRATGTGYLPFPAVGAPPLYVDVGPGTTDLPALLLVPEGQLPPL